MLLLLTVPTSFSIDGAALFDEHMNRFARYVAGGVLSQQAFRELQLAIHFSDPYFPHLGAGLTSAESTAPEAYLVSLATAASAPQPLLVMTPATNPRLLALPINIFAEDAHTRLTARTRTTDKVSTLHDIESDSKEWPQSILTHIVNSYNAATLHQNAEDPGNQCIAHFCRAKLLPWAKNWLRCLTSPGLGKHIHKALSVPGLASIANHLNS